MRRLLSKTNKLTIISRNGQVPKRSNGADCKSAGISLRRFEPFPAHQGKNSTDGGVFVCWYQSRHRRDSNPSLPTRAKTPPMVEFLFAGISPAIGGIRTLPCPPGQKLHRWWSFCLLVSVPPSAGFEPFPAHQGKNSTDGGVFVCWYQSRHRRDSNPSLPTRAKTPPMVEFLFAGISPAIGGIRTLPCPPGQKLHRWWSFCLLVSVPPSAGFEPFPAHQGKNSTDGGVFVCWYQSRHRRDSNPSLPTRAKTPPMVEFLFAGISPAIGGIRTLPCPPGQKLHRWWSFCLLVSVPPSAGFEPFPAHQGKNSTDGGVFVCWYQSRHRRDSNPSLPTRAKTPPMVEFLFAGISPAIGGIRTLPCPPGQKLHRWWSFCLLVSVPPSAGFEPFPAHQGKDPRRKARVFVWLSR